MKNDDAIINRRLESKGFKKKYLSEIERLKKKVDLHILLLIQILKNYLINVLLASLNPLLTHYAKVPSLILTERNESKDC